MPLFITDNSTIFTSSIPVPEVGDRVTADSVRHAFQGLLDRTGWLRDSTFTTHRDDSGFELLRFKHIPGTPLSGWPSTAINTGSLLLVSQGVGPLPPYAYQVVGNDGNAVRFSSFRRCVMAGCTDANSTETERLRVSMWITPMTACTGSQLLVEKRYRKDQAIASSGSIFQPGIAWDMFTTQIDSQSPGFTALQVRVRTGQSGTTSMVHELLGDPASTVVRGAIVPFQLNHVGFTYDGTAIRGYVNGFLSTSTSYTGSIDYNTGSANTGPGPIAIGARVSTNDGEVQPFVGIVHEVKVEKGAALPGLDPTWWLDTYVTGSRKYTWNTPT